MHILLCSVFSNEGTKYSSGSCSSITATATTATGHLLRTGKQGTPSQEIWTRTSKLWKNNKLIWQCSSCPAHVCALFSINTNQLINPGLQGFQNFWTQFQRFYFRIVTYCFSVLDHASEIEKQTNKQNCFLKSHWKLCNFPDELKVLVCSLLLWWY